LNVRNLERRRNNSQASKITRSVGPEDVFDFLRVRSSGAYEHLPIGYLTLNRKGRIVDINRAASRILGFSERELMGRNFFTLLDPDDKKIMEKSGHRLQDMRNTSQMNLRIQNVSGRTWIKVLVMETDFLDHQALYLFFTDITTQKQTEKELGWQLRVTREMDAITETILQPDTDYRGISRIVLAAAADLTQSANGFIARLPETFHSSVEMIFDQVYPENCILKTPSMTLSLNGSDGAITSLGKAINTGKPFFTTQSPEKKSAHQVPDGHISTNGLLAVPLIVNQRPRGLLFLANPKSPYSQEMVKMVTRLAKLYTIALKLEFCG
jgi:PAS domain S-box-containing protein